jgi:hypothetical protein
VATSYTTISVANDAARSGPSGLKAIVSHSDPRGLGSPVLCSSSPVVAFQTLRPDTLPPTASSAPSGEKSRLQTPSSNGVLGALLHCGFSPPATYTHKPCILVIDPVSRSWTRIGPIVEDEASTTC